LPGTVEKISFMNAIAIFGRGCVYAISFWVVYALVYGPFLAPPVKGNVSGEAQHDLQMRRYDEQQKKTGEFLQESERQQKRMDAILTQQEEQAKRLNAVISAWERQGPSKR
jgi:hypothetical protein